jgi:signal transduction histidine kinase
MSAGRLTLEPEEVNLVAIVRDVAAQLEDLQRASGSAIAIEPRSQPTGLWDPFRITQVVSNLLGNALKYGDGKPIEVTIGDEGDSARLSVRDHGIGIHEDAQPRIFDRFERAVTSREYAGFGVGLWICRQIVEAHGGSIRVESRLGAGAEFIVVLPQRLHSEVA